MAGFDGWDARLYGDAMALPGDELMHFRTKGSKNGVRRFQQEDGTWTPLGLKERKAREGWGDGDDRPKNKKEKKAISQAEKAAKRLARSEKKFNRQQKFEQWRNNRKNAMENRYKNRQLRNVSDEELEKRIARIKMEREYKELMKNPAVDLGERAVKAYLGYRKEKAARKEREAKMQKDMLDAKARLITAQADKAFAAKRGNIKARKLSAKAEREKVKNETRKHTVRGAIQQVTHDILAKRGQNYVKKVDKTYGELVKNGGKRVNNIITRSRDKLVNQIANDLQRYDSGGSHFGRKKKNRGSRSNPMFG